MGLVVKSLMGILMSCLLTGQIKSEDAHSFDFYNFLHTMNGGFDNSVQSNNGNDFIQARFMPVDVYSLRPAIVIFFEEASNGKVFRLYTSVVTEESDGSIKMSHYDIKNASFYDYPPGTLDINVIQNLPLESIDMTTDCKAIFEAAENGTFVGGWQICTDLIRGMHPNYGFTVFCDDFFVVVPVNSPEATTVEPYHMVRVSPRYQSPFLPSDFQADCQDGSS